jgi:hypothetical protein
MKYAFFILVLWVAFFYSDLGILIYRVEKDSIGGHMCNYLTATGIKNDGYVHWDKSCRKTVIHPERPVN